MLHFDLEAETRRAAILGQAHLEALRSALVLLQNATDLPLYLLPLEAPLGAGDAGRQAVERNLDSTAELVMHRLLFIAPLRRTAQHYGLAGVGTARQLD